MPQRTTGKQKLSEIAFYFSFRVDHNPWQALFLDRSIRMLFVFALVESDGKPVVCPLVALVVSKSMRPCKVETLKYVYHV